MDLGVKTMGELVKLQSILLCSYLCTFSSESNYEESLSLAPCFLSPSLCHHFKSILPL